MIAFSKMHGIGNDFVLINGFKQNFEPAALPSLSVEMCDRRFGIGSDGLILVERGAQAPFRMRMFNPDGSESEMCGNGIRCYAQFVLEEGLTHDEVIPVETGAGLLTLTVHGPSEVTVDMGIAGLERGVIGMSGSSGERFIDQMIELDGNAFRCSAVSMGNPHLVVIVDDVDSVPLERWGPELEQHPLFPARVNVHCVQVVDRQTLRQKTWERGAGITLACGTGACAAAVSGFLMGLSERSATVKLPGGDLRIEYLENGRVMMTGPAETAFRGNWPD